MLFVIYIFKIDVLFTFPLLACKSHGEIKKGGPALIVLLSLSL